MLLRHDDLPFSVTSEGHLKYLNGHLSIASPEAVLLALLIKEVQTLNKKPEAIAETTESTSAQISQKTSK